MVTIVFKLSADNSRTRACCKQLSNLTTNRTQRKRASSKVRLHESLRNDASHTRTHTRKRLRRSFSIPKYRSVSSFSTRARVCYKHCTTSCVKCVVKTVANISTLLSSFHRCYKGFTISADVIAISKGTTSNSQQLNAQKPPQLITTMSGDLPLIRNSGKFVD